MIQVVTRFIGDGDISVRAIDLGTFKELKGQSQGHKAILKGLKVTFRTKILRKARIPRMELMPTAFKQCQG